MKILSLPKVADNLKMFRKITIITMFNLVI